MKKVRRFWPFILITVLVFLFFFPVFKGNIPFPGDLLVSTNPYKTESFLGYAPGGYPNKAQGPDVTTQIYPWRFFSFSLLKQGSIPFWNPYNFSGNPQLADFQTALFYPFNILYFIFPFNFSWTLLIMLQPLLAGFFMYLFLKKGIGARDFPSFLGALSYSFSSYMVVWIEYGNIGSTILWLPLALLLTKYYFEKYDIKSFLGLILTLFITVLAGYIQGAFYIFFLSFIYYSFLVFSRKDEIKNYKKNFLFLASLILPFLLSFFQTLPTLSIFFQSTRGAYTLSQIQKNLAPVFSWITIFFPDFFGNPATRNYWIDGTYIERVLYPGSVIVFFAFYALTSKIKVLEKRFFAAVAIISLVIATNLPFVKYFYLIPISVISTTIPTREFSIFIFCMIVLGVLGLDHFLNEKTFKKKFLILYLGLLMFVWLLVVLAGKFLPQLKDNLTISLHNLIIPSMIILLTMASIYIIKRSKKIGLIFLTVLVVFDLFYFFNKITPFSPQELIYPNTPIINYIKSNAGINRFWGYGSAYIPANFQSVDQTFSPEGNDPLHIFRYGEFLAASRNGQLPSMLPRPDANVFGGYGTDELKSNFFRKRALDILGVKYILNEQELKDAWQESDTDTFPSKDYKLVKKIYPWQVYENLNALPRFFLAANFVTATNKSQEMSFVYSKNINLLNTIVLEKSPSIAIDPKGKGKVNLLSYSPNLIKFNVNTTGNSLLFISDNYYPEWKVKVDGVDREILRADYTFRAVAVPKGVHEVEFYYDPISFKEGLGISFLTLLILVSGVVYVIINFKGAKK